MAAYRAYRQAVGRACQQAASLQRLVEGTVGKACWEGRRPCVAEGMAAYRSEAWRQGLGACRGAEGKEACLVACWVLFLSARSISRLGGVRTASAPVLHERWWHARHS